METAINSVKLVVLILVAIWLVGPMAYPTEFGTMLNQIDQARWPYLDHGYEYDYTKEP